MSEVDKIIYINSRNESITFCSLPPYKLMSINGLGGLGNSIVTEKSPFQYGSSRLNSAVEERRINFDILIMCRNALEIKDRRREISKVLNPILGLGTLKYVYADGEVKVIQCEVEVAPVFVHSAKHPSDRFQITQFTLFCPQPFYEDENYSVEEMKAFLNKFKFPLKLPTAMGGEGSKVNIINEGDVPSPVKITFTGASINPTIRNLTTGEFIRLEKELLKDDVLTINTEFGNKRIEINGQNAYSYISDDSTLWELQLGENLIAYETDSGAKNAFVTVEFKNRFVGI
jgi:hypothetical protein